MKELIYLVIIGVSIGIFINARNSDNTYNDDYLSGNSTYHSTRNDTYDFTYDDIESNREPENPYDDGTGHYAGFEWAEV